MGDGGVSRVEDLGPARELRLPTLVWKEPKKQWIPGSVALPGPQQQEQQSRTKENLDDQ
jgi:hypothetical protein